MKNLNFKYAFARNFLPFGPEGVEIKFDRYKNLILIRGENRDAKQIDHLLPTDDYKISNNGAGKSSLQEIIVYGLFGKTVKRPEKVGINDVVHNKIGKDCYLEIIFDDYRIVRTRKDGGKDNKNSLRLWKSEQEVWTDDTEITLGTMPLTQKKIEEEIGLSYDAFVNMCIFTDDQRACFLECDNGKKREIVENLLSLGIYREWFENAKALRKEIKSNIDQQAKEFALLLGNKADAERRLNLTKQREEEWKKNKQAEIESFENKIQFSTQKLKNTDNGVAIIAYEQAQLKIKSINENLPTLEASKEELTKKYQLAKDKESEQKLEAQKLKNQYEEFAAKAKSKLNDRKAKETKIADLEANVPGTQCDQCVSIIDAKNIDISVRKLKEEINDINLNIQKELDGGKEIAAKVEELKTRQTKVANFIKQFNDKVIQVESELKKLRTDLITASQVREPKADSAEFLLQQQIEEFKNQLDIKKKELSGLSPFKEILDNDNVELNNIVLNVINKEKEIKLLEAELPYYDYWIIGFGENGIRKWVIDGIIPELNNRINYWLQFLIDNTITLKFDNQLEETIERNPVDGDPYVYHAMSTGQRRRLNLAVSQSFAHIMMLSSGSIPSIVFLDEVSTNVDPLGVQGIYNMISELAEDKQVFITTHDQDLLRMLQGTDMIQLTHENGFTKLIE